ncbi:hypothetical protein BS47DRAFT_1358768 [Hydnum rufescens UP504]|uniref:Uncharacterized protein n=1 Tax=Hydnum rufescens UP504 TaxID=1448309 RepID=A0A9P6DYQ3_9AGAM|nr:hypothetical protein BS47DRAFT_1358768 [Hydnum rufescens UP504]
MGDETNWTIVPIFSFSRLQFPIQEIEDTEIWANYSIYYLSIWGWTRPQGPEELEEDHTPCCHGCVVIGIRLCTLHTTIQNPPTNECGPKWVQYTAYTHSPQGHATTDKGPHTRFSGLPPCAKIRPPPKIPRTLRNTRLGMNTGMNEWQRAHKARTETEPDTDHQRMAGQQTEPSPRRLRHRHPATDSEGPNCSAAAQQGVRPPRKACFEDSICKARMNKNSQRCPLEGLPKWNPGPDWGEFQLQLCKKSSLWLLFLGTGGPQGPPGKNI